MSAALMFRPAAKWRIASAFAAAVMLHVGAVALAERGAKPVSAAPPADDGGLEVQFVDPPTEPPPASLDDPLPAPPTTDSWITEEPPRRAAERPKRPLVRPGSPGSVPRTVSPGALALRAPRPEYPYEARRQRLTGSGIALLTIDPASGLVLEVTMAQSTGSAILDNAALSGFRRWRFLPGTPARVRTPITFTLTGATY